MTFMIGAVTAVVIFVYVYYQYYRTEDNMIKTYINKLKNKHAPQQQTPINTSDNWTTVSDIDPNLKLSILKNIFASF